MTFSPFLFSLFYLFILLPPFLFASFFKKKIYSLPGARDVFWGSVFHLKRKALRLCCSASMHVHTCAFSDDLCDTFFFFFLQKNPQTPAFASAASSSSAVNATQTDREDMSSFEEEEKGLRVINCVKMNVSPAPSSTAHFISCIPVWRTHIHLSAPCWLHLPPQKNRVRPSPAPSSSLSLYFMSCRHLQTSLTPFVTKTTGQTRA